MKTYNIPFQFFFIAISFSTTRNPFATFGHGHSSSKRYVNQRIFRKFRKIGAKIKGRHAVPDGEMTSVIS
jgi:hypothetical protein